MHTEGKWRQWDNQKQTIYVPIKGGKIETICRVDTNRKDWEANAKRIVQAVNSFDDLLEVAKLTLSLIYQGKVYDSRKELRKMVYS